MPILDLAQYVPVTFTVSGNTVAGTTLVARAIGWPVADYKTCGGSKYGDDGILHKNCEVPGGRKFREITDSLSNIVMVGESAQVTTNTAPTLGGTGLQDWPTILATRGDEMTRINGRLSAPINHGVNLSWLTKSINNDAAFTDHICGAQFLFADGSIHFIIDEYFHEGLRQSALDQGRLRSRPVPGSV